MKDHNPKSVVGLIGFKPNSAAEGRG
jgi:hypothetical protein